VEKEIAPVAAEHDGRGEIAPAVRGALAELGVFGALAPAALGGLDLDLVTAAMIVEEVARGWGALGSLLASHLAASRVVARASAPERERWVPALTRGETLAVPVVGGAITARQDGADWVVDGQADLIEGASRARLLVVRARDGVGFLVPADALGLTIGAPTATLGFRGLEPASVQLDGVRLPGSAYLDLWDAALLETIGGVGAAATAVGIAQAAFEAALRYSQQRTAFGKPICQHQAIQLKLADMASRSAAARLMTYRAAERLGRDPADMMGAAMARIEAAETAAMVTLESMRIHGGYGYTTEFPVERYYRDAAALFARAR